MAKTKRRMKPTRRSHAFPLRHNGKVRLTGAEWIKERDKCHYWAIKLNLFKIQLHEARWYHAEGFSVEEILKMESCSMLNAGQVRGAADIPGIRRHDMHVLAEAAVIKLIGVRPIDNEAAARGYNRRKEVVSAMPPEVLGQQDLGEPEEKAVSKPKRLMAAFSNFFRIRNVYQDL